MLEPKANYYAHRETLALNMAARASTEAIRAIHMIMAERYAALAKVKTRGQV